MLVPLVWLSPDVIDDLGTQFNDRQAILSRYPFSAGGSTGAYRCST